MVKERVDKIGRFYHDSEVVAMRVMANAPKITLMGKEYRRDEIYKDDELKKLLVAENPIEAHQLYLIFREHEESKQGETLGKIFAEKYNGDKVWGWCAYDIGKDLGIIVSRPPSELIEAIEEEERSIKK